MSTPLNAPGPTFSTRIVSPLKVTVLPDRALRTRTPAASRTGNLRSSRILQRGLPHRTRHPDHRHRTPEAMLIVAYRI